MKFLHGVALAGLLQVACEQATVEGAPPADSVSVHKSRWQDFITALDRSLDRIVPEVRDGRLVKIRYFHGLPEATRIGLVSGDRIVAVNGRSVDGVTTSANHFLHSEMQRSLDKCQVSFAIESGELVRTVGAHCE
jgi:hypothetical protein